MIIHKVESGDTVFSIAAEYGVSAELLVINNGLQGIENALPQGLSIVVLVPSVTHTVKEGETTRSIAARYNITQNDLYRKNLILQGVDIIYPGQTLVIAYQDEPLYSYDIGGYTYPSIDLSVLNSSLPLMKLFMPFTYGFRPDGSLVLLNDELLINRALHYGTRPYFHLSTLTENGEFSNSLSSSLLASTDKWPILADNVIETMNEKGYVGLDFDFEFLNAGEKYIYPEFISYMRNRVSEYSYPLIVALPPKTSDDQQGLLYAGVDYALLGQASDRVLCMTYE